MHKRALYSHIWWRMGLGQKNIGVGHTCDPNYFLDAMIHCIAYEFLGGTQASMSPRRTEWLRGVENYTHFFHKKINISTTIYLFFSLLSLIERYLSPLFNEVIFRFKKKSFIMAFLPKRYPILYFSLCYLVIFSREYCPKWRKIYVTRQR